MFDVQREFGFRILLIGTCLLWFIFHSGFVRNLQHGRMRRFQRYVTSVALLILFRVSNNDEWLVQELFSKIYYFYWNSAVGFLFAVLPVKVAEKSNVVRHLFLKMHLTREKCPQKPEYQTLFIIGVPEFCDQVNYIYNMY